MNGFDAMVTNEVTPTEWHHYCSRAPLRFQQIGRRLELCIRWQLLINESLVAQFGVDTGWYTCLLIFADPYASHLSLSSCYLVEVSWAHTLHSDCEKCEEQLPAPSMRFSIHPSIHPSMQYAKLCPSIRVSLPFLPQIQGGELTGTLPTIIVKFVFGQYCG